MASEGLAPRFHRSLNFAHLQDYRFLVRPLAEPESKTFLPAGKSTLLCILPPRTKLLTRGSQDPTDFAEAAERSTEQSVSAPSPPSGFRRWIYRDAHSRVSILVLAAGREQLTTSFCIFKVSPQLFTPFSTSSTASLLHSASKKD